MTKNFYDRVAKKFGAYGRHVEYTTDSNEVNGEEVFKEKLLEYSGKDKVALDIGCADGKFTLAASVIFKNIIGIDISKEMLKSAKNLKNKSKIKNVSFKYMSVRRLMFKEESFDVVYNRRGPQDFKQFYRVLKPRGYYLEIRIGEKDTKTLKQTFGRGQNYGMWNEPVLAKDKEGLKDAGFKVLFAKEYFFNEYYQTEQEFDLFLQGVPIFEDYDSRKDKVKLLSYVKNNRTSKGIRLERHRVITVSQRKND